VLLIGGATGESHEGVNGCDFPAVAFRLRAEARNRFALFAALARRGRQTR